MCECRLMLGAKPLPRSWRVGLVLGLALIFAQCERPPGDKAGPETICSDSQDNDGDGLVDCDDPDCDSDAACTTPKEICDNESDDDGDSLVDCDDPDCDPDPTCVEPVEDCDNGLDDDDNGHMDCYDSACQADAYCQPADFAHGADFWLAESSSVSIVVASDFRDREPRVLHVILDGLQLSLEEATFVSATVSESFGFSFGVAAGLHRFSLDLDGQPVWDFGEVEFRAGLHQTLIAFGGTQDASTLVFEQPTGLGPGEVVVRMVNLWDTREPLDVLLCPPGDLDLCSTVHQDLTYGEVWERTIDGTEVLHLGWERPPPPGYPLDRHIGVDSSPLGQPYCWTFGPHYNETVLSTMHLSLPYTVSLDPDCLGCTSGFALHEPFPVDWFAVPGVCAQ